jgi:hypothetical protein
MARRKKTDRQIRDEKSARAKARRDPVTGRFRPGRFDSAGRFVVRMVPPTALAPSVVAVVECVADTLDGALEIGTAEWGAIYYGIGFPDDLELHEVSDAMRTCEARMPDHGQILIAVQMLIRSDDGDVYSDWRSIGYATRPDFSWAHAQSELPKLAARYAAITVLALSVLDWGDIEPKGMQ